MSVYRYGGGYLKFPTRESSTELNVEPSTNMAGLGMAIIIGLSLALTVLHLWLTKKRPLPQKAPELMNLPPRERRNGFTGSGGNPPTLQPGPDNDSD